MNKTVFSIITISLLLLSGLLINPVSSESTINITSGTTLYVDDDFTSSTPGWGVDCFNVIQDAIDNATDNDTVFVYNGKYNENIVINKSINLIGEDNENTIINPGNDITTTLSMVILINNDYVDISNFNIIAEENSRITIMIVCSSYIKINDNRLSGGSLSAGDSFFMEITENFGSSIFLCSSNNNVISKNNINRISLINSDNNEISYNEIKSTSTGSTGMIIDEGCINNIITYNVIQDCDYGIHLGVCDENTISYNDFIGNKIMNAYILSSKSTWYRNYWGRPKILPKIIIGYGMPKIFIDFDWFPAKTPNCDFGGDN